MKEALKRALEALERSITTCFNQYSHHQVMSQQDHFINQAITAIKAALAQPAQQEPDFEWTCNECDSPEFTSVLSKADLQNLACTRCGCNEFHKVALAQPIIQNYLEKDNLQQNPLTSIDYVPCCTDQTCPKCKAATPPQRTWSDYEPDGMHHNKPAKRPQNCGTGYCSCIECVMEPAQQKPVGYFGVNDYGRWEENENEQGQPFYTTPPQRTWVGLTIGEIQDLIKRKEYSPFALAEDIEAKLKEKNT